MIEVLNHTGSHRSLAEIFTPTSFKNIIKNEDTDLFKKKIRKHLALRPKTAVSEILEQLYETLLVSYRSEFFYKNTLLNEQLLKKYNLSTTTVLAEFKIGKSIADFVLLNGESKLFEIKSDLDSLQKLPKQIIDYQKFASKIYVVTAERFLNKLLEDYENTPIGIILFNSNGTLVEFKSAIADHSHLEHEAIFKTLRRDEYLDIVKKYFGRLPQVPNTRIFQECFTLVKEIDITIFQSLAIEKLKERKLPCCELLTSKETPFELKYLCYMANLNESEYYQLYNFLKLKI